MNEEKTIFDKGLSDTVSSVGAVSKQKAEQVFHFFRDCNLFRWADANNDCEDRANAACLLLEQWGIPCIKAWVFSGAFLKRDEGELSNKWNYHVAAALPVQEESGLSFYVLDPATLNETNTIGFWAEQITNTPRSYHLVKLACVYIFDPVAVTKGGWFNRDSQNFKWTMQGLAGINGVTKTGQAQLVFNKKRIEKTEEAFKLLLLNKPHFL